MCQWDQCRVRRRSNAPSSNWISRLTQGGAAAWLTASLPTSQLPCPPCLPSLLTGAGPGSHSAVCGGVGGA
jgi:hypothetical protein